MTVLESLQGLMRAMAKEVIAELRTDAPAPSTRALTRRQAEKAMGVGRSKLQELIATGQIRTVKGNPRLVPMVEVERYCQPRRQKPRRRVVARPAPQGTQNPEALREVLRRGRA